MLKTNFLWKGLAYYSLENCVVENTGEGFQVDSVIIGMFDNEIYRAAYTIIASSDWSVTYFEVKFNQKGTNIHLSVESIGKGLWNINGKHLPEFDGCLDLDISITPFTNTIPINRLKLNEGESGEINVIYINLFEDETRRVRQKYMKVSNEKYKYENVPNDFEAEIEVDTSGFVVNYPSLFVLEGLTSWSER